MRELDLLIHPKLKKWLIDAVEYDQENGTEMILIKGFHNDTGPEEWSMSVVPQITAGDMKKNEQYSYVKADGLVFLSVQDDILHEVEGKFMDWCDNGPCLINRA